MSEQFEGNQNHYQDYTDQMQNQPANINNNQPEGPKTNGFHITGLVLGIIGMLTSCCYGIPGILFGVIGLIFAIVGNKKSKSGVGIAGLICSIISIVLGAVMTFYFVLVGVEMYKLFQSGDAQDINELIRQMQMELQNY